MNAVVVMLVVMMVLMDVLLIATPWVMPRTECFAVSVPSGARDEEPLRGYLRSYALWMAVVSLACIAVMVVAGPRLEDEVAVASGNVLFPAAASVGMLAPVAVSFVLMLHYRQKVQQVKSERGWRAERVRGAALVGPEEYPEPLSMLWDLAYVPLVIAMVVFGLANYDRFPDMLPMSAHIDGSVGAYVPKRLGTVLFPALVTCYFAVIMSVAHCGIVHSKRPIDPDAPASSALAYGSFARKMSIVLIGGGIVLCAVVGTTYYASALGVIPLMTSALVVMVFVLGYAIAASVIGMRMGQAGALLYDESQDGGMARDDDAHWKLGIFYVNGDDPSVFVPKRFGFGWTLNMARPGAWAMTVGLIVVVAVFIYVTNMVM